MITVKITAIALAAAVAFGGWQTWRNGTLERKLLAQELDFNAKILLQTNKALSESERVRTLEAQLTTQATENQNALLAQKDVTRTVAAQWAAEHGRLRKSIADFAAGRGLSAESAATSCSERAATLGRGLDETLRTEEDLVRQLEDQRADTRSLLRDANAIRSLISTERARAASPAAAEPQPR